MRECWTQARMEETLWSNFTVASSTGTGVMTTTLLTLKSTQTKMITIPHAQDWALQPTKVVSRGSQLSQANLTLQAIWTSRSVSTPSEGQGTFMRFETGGVATEHLWSNELQKSPLAKVVFRETTGANSPFQPAWLQRRLSGLRQPSSRAYVKSWPNVPLLSRCLYALAARSRLGCRRKVNESCFQP